VLKVWQAQDGFCVVRFPREYGFRFMTDGLYATDQ
jgi:hypothetical protein